MPLQHEGDSPQTIHPVPEWGVDIKCGKGTAFSYGPWADRQRESIYKFFFPPDYQPMKVSKDQLGHRIAIIYRSGLLVIHHILFHCPLAVLHTW